MTSVDGRRRKGEEGGERGEEGGERGEEILAGGRTDGPVDQSKFVQKVHADLKRTS